MLLSLPRMVGNIRDPDYETVTAECEHCGSVCVFNRLDDVGEPGPYAGRDVTCLECGRTFWIYGDIINPAYELLIGSARERFKTKRYMQCIALLAQAWEIFFSAYVFSNYLYRPYFASPTADRGPEPFNTLSSQLFGATRRHTFHPLRNVLVNTVVRGVHPSTLQESGAAIRRIADENFGRDPKEADVEAFPDADTRDLLGRLRGLAVGELRNDVVHQHARRPRRAEVERCLEEEVGLLYRAKHRLPVYTFEEWRVRSATGGP